MTKPLKVGIIGVGTIGQAHLRAFTAHKESKVVAIADINKKALDASSKKFKVDKTFTDYQDLLALDEVEAVVVCTPPFVHAKIVCDAASAGKHVLCEKPMALNSREAEKMVEACNKAGVQLGICSARSRLTPTVELAKEYLTEGKIGRIYYARMTMIRRRGRPGIDILKESKWFLDSSKAGGGALIDIGCYDIDVMLYLLGDVQPMAVSAITFTGIGEPVKLETVYDVEEHSSVFVKFKKDLAVTFETSWASNLNSYRETILFGTKAALKLDPFTYYTEEDDREVTTTINFPREPWGSWEKLIKDFVSACRKNRKPKTPGEDGLKVMQIIEMAYKSAKLGKEVSLSDL